MNVDSIFCIGKTHKVCQDYAMAGFSSPLRPFAIVSDGCSSSPDTDFGARILTRICAAAFSEHRDIDPKEMIEEAKVMAKLLGLHPQSLDATLLAVDYKNGKYTIRIFGDGSVAKIREDGNIEVISVEYLSGAPFYLNYGLDQKRKMNFIEKYGLKRRIHSFSLNPDGTVATSTTREDSDGTYYLEEGFAYNYKTFVVMSDGASSFYELINTGTSKSQQPLMLNTVLPKLLDIKGYQGEFIQRRVQRFAKDCEKINWNHADDLSLGVIHLGE